MCGAFGRISSQGIYHHSGHSLLKFMGTIGFGWWEEGGGGNHSDVRRRIWAHFIRSRMTPFLTQNMQRVPNSVLYLLEYGRWLCWWELGEGAQLFKIAAHLSAFHALFVRAILSWKYAMGVSASFIHTLIKEWGEGAQLFKCTAHLGAFWALFIPVIFDAK